MKIIKASRVYRAELPAADILRGHLAELSFSDLTECDYSKTGFVPAPGSPDGDLVTVLATGYAMALRFDEKIVPAASVKAALAKRVADLEEFQGFKLGREEIRALRDEVFQEMVKVALHRTTIVPFFYDPKSQYLFVNTTSQRMADLVMRDLVRVVGSIKTQTIHIAELKGDLTTRLKEKVLLDKDSFGEFELGGSFWLKLESEKVSIEQQEDSGPLREALEAGLRVEALRLAHGPVTFKLSSDFVFSGITFGEPDEQEEFSSMAEAWMAEAATQVRLMVDVVASLCNLVGYKAPDPS